MRHFTGSPTAQPQQADPRKRGVQKKVHFRVVMVLRCAAPLLQSQIECFHRHRFAVIPDWIPPGTISRLKKDALELDAEGLAVASLVGNGAGEKLNDLGLSMRKSRSIGLFPPPPNHVGCVATRDEIYRSIRALREQLQSASQLELPPLKPFDIELKYLLYPVGGHFTRHLDAKREDGGWRLDGRCAADGGSFSGSAHRRVVSFILYLNEHWDAADGGALRVYPAHAPRSTTEHVMDIPPDGGTLVLLLDSAVVEHAVLETHRERQCVVGWFREGSSIRVPDRDEMSLRTKYW